MNSTLPPIFIPGKLVNPLNGSHGHWTKHWRRGREWRDRTGQHILFRWGKHDAASARLPKRVTFILHTGAPWDDDALPAGVKPVRDSLVGMGIIHSDAPDSGHVFAYQQVIHRGKGSLKKRGVEIMVEQMTPPGGIPSES